MKRKIARSMYNNPIWAIVIVSILSIFMFKLLCYANAKRKTMSQKAKTPNGIAGRGGVNFLPTERAVGTPITKAPISLYASPSA